MIKRLQLKNAKNIKNAKSTNPKNPDLGGCTIPDDLPEESAAAIANSMKEVAREISGVNIGVVRKMLPCRSVNVSGFVVTLPPSLTQEQRAELDYWLREVCGNIEYAGE
ncbi:MAG: hypothetical protein ACRYFS_19890 [Janthinobacterium lividum]